jgi:hypothetical protein
MKKYDSSLGAQFTAAALALTIACCLCDDAGDSLGDSGGLASALLTAPPPDNQLPEVPFEAPWHSFQGLKFPNPSAELPSDPPASAAHRHSQCAVAPATLPHNLRRTRPPSLQPPPKVPHPWFFAQWHLHTPTPLVTPGLHCRMAFS